MRGVKQTLRAFVAGSLLLVGAGISRPAFAAMTSGRVICSTITASPTLFSAGGNWRHTKLINANTDYALIGDSSTSFSHSPSTGTARIATPASTAARELDLGDYAGPLYCVGSGNGTPGSGSAAGTVIDYWRFK